MPYSRELPVDLNILYAWPGAATKLIEQENCQDILLLRPLNQWAVEVECPSVETKIFTAVAKTKIFSNSCKYVH